MPLIFLVALFLVLGIYTYYGGLVFGCYSFFSYNYENKRIYQRRLAHAKEVEAACLGVACPMFKDGAKNKNYKTGGEGYGPVVKRDPLTNSAILKNVKFKTYKMEAKMEKMIFFNTRIRNFVVCSIFLISIIGLAQGAFAKSIILKLGHVAPNNSIYDIAANKFAERVAARTNDEVKINVFGGSKFGNLMQHWSQLSSGVLDIHQINPTFAALVEAPPKNLFITSAPYLYDTQEQYRKFFETDLFKSMMGKVEKTGNFKFIGYFGDRAPRGLSTSKAVVTSPEDLKGLKICVPKNPIFVKFWKALGANPTPLPVTEFYTGLKTGLVDGQENPIIAVKDAGYYEVQKYYTFTDYQRHGMAGFINQRKWKSLSSAHQTAIQMAAKDTAKYLQEYVDNKIVESTKYTREKGMTMIYPNVEPFKKIAKEATLQLDAEGKMWESGLYARVKAELEKIK